MPRYRLQDDIHLPLPTALWVLAAHGYALFVPLVLVMAVNHHWAAVTEMTDYPGLFYVAAAVMMAGSAFEIGQNALDKWYLTADTGSVNGTGFCDFMFYWLIVGGQALLIIACQGAQQWVIWLSVLVVGIFPLLYFRQVAQLLPLAVVGLGSLVAAYLSFGDPVIFLQLLLSPLTMYFFSAMLITGNQALHGVTTLVASSGVLFLAWAIHGGAEGTPQSWLMIVVIAIVVGATARLFRPSLLGLAVTRRISG
jgi:hypothetical protein